MSRLFGGGGWSLESLTPPWGSLEPIYEHVRSRRSDPLPDETLIQEKYKFGWIGGAWDGVLGHSCGVLDTPMPAFDIVPALKNLLKRADARTMGIFYRSIVEEPLFPSLELLVQELAQLTSSVDRARLLKLGRYLALRSGHREAVKFGLTLIGLVGSTNDIENLMILGQNDEFTLYAAVAIENVAVEPELAIWELAKSVHNWGRIQTVERLKYAKNPEVQAWMLREGFRNGVMNEYLACICARTGRLHEALQQRLVDDALLNGAADMIRALITGGPAEGIDDYPQAVDVCEAYLSRVWERRNLGLSHLLAVDRLRWFLALPDGWEMRQSSGWTEGRRAALRATCDDVFGWETWKEQTLLALSAADEQAFYQADSAAQCLSIDTWDVHFSRVKAAPVTSGSWYRLMQQTDESRIEEVLAFAERAIPFEEIEIGPGTEVGLGLDFRPHQALDWVLQDLRRFPGRGWRLIKAGIRSPVIRNRNMAIKALAVWSRESWPLEANELLLNAHELDPDEKVRGRLGNLLEGKPPFRAT